LRLRFTLVTLCLVALLPSPAVLAVSPAGPGPVTGPLPVYQEPHGYFSLPVPAGWHSLLLEHPGERLYVFTPEDISADQLRLGVDVMAVLTLRISTISPEGAKVPAAELLRLDLDGRLRGYKEHGVAATGQPGPPVRLGGVDLASSTIAQPGYDEFVAVGVRGRLFYALEYQWERRRQAVFRPLLEQMAAGLSLPEPVFRGETNRYESASGAFALTLPAGWAVQERTDGGTTGFRLSPEKPTPGPGQPRLGATLTRIRPFSANLTGRKVTIPRDQVGLRAAQLLDPSRHAGQVVFALEEVNLDGRVGLFWERSYRSPSSEAFLQEFHLVVAKEDTLYDVVLAAPLADFELYRETFRQALQTLALH
jgi:hypothetical protein